jgi:DNA-binding NarL/FixJ family response regulator
LLSESNWEVVAEARNGREAVEFARQSKPDIAVLDISMPALNGLEAARLIGSESPRTRVLVLTMHESDQLIAEAVEAGVRGFVLKSDAGKDLVRAIEALGNNETYFNSRVSQVILGGHLKTSPNVTPGKPAEPLTRLTERQREVVQLLADGKSSKEIAVILDGSVKTIETHRVNIMRRLNCHSVADLIRYAIRNAIVPL